MIGDDSRFKNANMIGHHGKRKEYIQLLDAGDRNTAF